jgi:hypothetical protein
LAQAEQFPLGFDATLNVFASRFDPAESGQRTLTYTNPVNSEATLKFTGGDFTPTRTFNLHVGYDDRVTIDDNSIGISLKLHRKNGRFDGSFVSSIGRRTPFSGIISQSLNHGSGFFLGENGDGLVEWVPK